MSITTDPLPLALADEEPIASKQKKREIIADKLGGLTEFSQLNAGIALAVTACLAYQAQAKGYTNELPEFAGATVESGAHPVLGFAGAWIGHAAVKFAERRERLAKKAARPLTVAAVGIGMTVADLAGETAQGIVTHTYLDFFNHKYETGKDALAAFVVGGGIYAYQNKRFNTKKLKKT